MEDMRRPDPEEIRRASSVIDETFLHSPILTSPAIDAIAGASVFFKDETRNPIGCFKGRGTSFLLTTSARPAVVTASAGNFGQGVAWTGLKRGVAVTVFASVNAVPAKIEAM